MIARSVTPWLLVLLLASVLPAAACASDTGGGVAGDTTSGTDAGTSDDDTASDPGAEDATADTTADATDGPAADATNTDPVILTEWECVTDDPNPDYLQSVGCATDFDALASEPADASIPGARSLKTVVDNFDNDSLYFQNSRTYPFHWDFCHAHLSGQGLPPVPGLQQFNSTEYYSPSRRFLLGIVTWYDEPGVWVYEIEPWDTATADMIARGFYLVRDNAWFGPALRFHPSSESIALEAANLPDDVPIITTDELFAGVTYQALNLGTTTGKLRFLESETLANSDLNFRDIALLDHVPNDIGVVSGIITSEHQTPLSHINVLSQNRGTPNMSLTGAFDDPELLTLDGKWVELTVGPFEWSIHEITQAEAETWWENNKPAEIEVPPLDLTTVDLRDMDELLEFDEEFTVDNPPTAEALKAALAKAIPAFGGKASHYGGFPYMDPEKVPSPKAWAIPVFYYRQHMEQHALDVAVSDMLADADFRGDAAVRAQMLADLQDAIIDAPIDADFIAAVHAKMEADYPGGRLRFRSSTNAEDLGGFTGAGLYTSKSGEIADPDKQPEEAIKKVWASIWNYKAYDEREYRSIDHEAIGMALLVHRSFPDEEANGVALTANIFDTSGLEPGFYINAQEGGASVVLPEPGVTTDQIIYYYYQPGQPKVFLSHSNQIAEGETVLTNTELFKLGTALDTIHKFWLDTYGPGPGSTAYYAMDVEFKFDGEPGEDPTLYVKQARPHPGWGL